MIQIVENNWRPFIVLTVKTSKEKFYFDVTKRPEIIAGEDCTRLLFGENSVVVEEKMEDIIEAVDKMIAEEQERKKTEAHEVYLQTQAAVAETAKKLAKSEK